MIAYKSSITLCVNRDVIQPDVLEESVLSAALRHLCLGDTVSQLTWHQTNQTEEFNLLTDVMSELYRKLYAIIRQLQVIIHQLVTPVCDQDS